MQDSGSDVDVLLPTAAHSHVGTTLGTATQKPLELNSARQAVLGATNVPAEDLDHPPAEGDANGIAGEFQGLDGGTDMMLTLSDLQLGRKGGDFNTMNSGGLVENGARIQVGEDRIGSGETPCQEEEIKTREELVETLLELRDALRTAQLAQAVEEQPPSGGVPRVVSCSATQPATSGKTALSLGPVEHIDLDALLAQAVDGSLRADNSECQPTAITVPATSRGYSEEELLDRLRALSDKRNAELEKAPQFAQGKELNGTHCVQRVAWADGGEGQTAVAVSESGMACQISSTTEVSLSTDALVGMQTTGTSAIGSNVVSWRDIITPSTSVTNGIASFAAHSRESTGQCLRWFAISQLFPLLVILRILENVPT